MKKDKYNLLSVKQAAEDAKVSEETVRRWIRSGKLRASVIGKSFYIDPWQLNMLLKLGQNLQANEISLTIAAMGLTSAMKGALIFDDAFFSLEIQFHRIQEDKLNLETGLLRHNKELEQQMIARREWRKRLNNSLSEKTEKLPDMPAVQINTRYWLIPQKTLFVDIHFYFVSGASIELAVKKLREEINDQELNEIINKYAKPLKDLNDARNDLEHLDERIDRVSELGNISSDGRYHFNDRYYDLYFHEVRQLRDELCDYLLMKAQNTLEQNK
jgi:excisionase family DNA binding protein